MSEENEVRRCDQEKINEFGRLNTRLTEIRADNKQAAADCEKMDDAISDLSMVLDGKVMLFMGETFIETSEEVANEYCERKVEELKAKIAKGEEEERSIVARQGELKKELYARFGNSINLETN